MKNVIIILLCLSLLLTACGSATDETGSAEYKSAMQSAEQTLETVSETDTIAVTESVTASEDYTLKFVDVNKKKHKTTILGSVPKHNYDFSGLDTSSQYYTYKDPATGEEALLGIDVSKYQGEIDWAKVKKAGIQFVIIRLGFRGYGDTASLNLDPMFEDNVKGATKAGLTVGVYFFSQAISKKEAVEEAQFVLENIKKYDIAGPVVIDTEELKNVENARTKGISGEIFTDCCVAFCQTIKEAGYQPMIYFNMMWQVYTLDVTKLTEFEKWYADYEKEPQSPYEFSIWQYSETGSVPGISGNVDLNLWFQ